MIIAAKSEFGPAQRGLLGSVALGLLFCVTPMMSVLAGVLFPPMAAEFGWSRTFVSVGVSVAFLFMALGTPLVGYLVRRVTARPVVLAYAVLYPVMLSAFAFIGNSFTLFLGMMALLGAVGAGTTPFAFFSILPRWFDRRLGLALGIGLVGSGVGQSILPIAANAINQAVGWRTGLAVLAIADALIVLPALWWFYRDPTNTIESAAAAALVPPSGIRLPQARRTSAFWLMAVAFFLISAVGAGCIIHMIPMITAKGYSTTLAARALSVVGIALLVSRPVAGALLDRFGGKVVGFVSFLLAAIGALLLAQSTSFPLLALGAFLVGVGLGTEGDLMAFLIRRQFGTSDFPAIYGVFGLIYGIGPLIGPPILGLSYDRFGSYQAGLYLFGFCAASAALLMLLIADTRGTGKSPREADPDRPSERPC